jgi:hypothetical protein
MTKQKKAQGGAKGNTAELKARAAEVIEDVRGYDGDARRAVWLALEHLKFAETNPPHPTKYTEAGFCERELREVLDKVERGLPVIDVDRLGVEEAGQARAVYDIIGKSNVPDFIANAVRVALEEAAREHGHEVWLDVDGSGDAGTGDYSIASMAYLFRMVGVGGPELEPKKDLAGYIAAVLKHPDVPTRIYEKLTDALVEMHDSTDVYNDPRAVGALLDYHARQRAEQERGE